ncbi:MAG TPA: HDIG domain-containing protein, partial [Planctomycetota bacterium]|nr:HDIG domain-containing protein [Planctomycetota bacterium]
PGLRETAEVLRTWLRRRIEPTLVYDPVATRIAKSAAEEAVPVQVVGKGPNDLLVSAHNRIGPQEYDMLLAEQDAYLASQSVVERWKRIGGVSVLVVVAFLLAGLLLRHYRPRVFQSKVRLAVLGLLTVLIVLVARLLLYVRWLPHPQYLVPVAFASMVLSLAYDRRFSCAVTVFIVVVTGLSTEADLRPLLVLLAGGLVASLYTVNIRKRTKLLKVGVLVGLAHVAVIAGVALGRLLEVRFFLEQAAVGMINGIGVGFIVTGLMPFFEPLFRITTDISLLELGDLNQPVLKSFALRAPGSYNHSLTVGVLAEAAARAIGADDLLTRVGSYFHDIGKINKPHYFVENQGDQGSRHDRLSPQMSALVITAHAKDGLELARELGLPRPILDIVAQHHGNTLVEYFYKQAKEEAGPDEPPDEHIFRYPGPRPRSREAAIVMLADSVESASRVLSDPTPSRVRWLVHEIIETKLRDGQLEDCDLTLRELHGIEDSLTRGLISVFHGRIKY